MDAGDDAGHLQSQVLRNTLAEVAARSTPVHEGGELSEPPACCVICLDGITEPCEARPCKHRNFDYLCLLNWLERSTRCPLCKGTIHEVGHDLDHDGLGTSRVYLVPQLNQVKDGASRAGEPRAQAQLYTSRLEDRHPDGRSDSRRHENFSQRPVTRDEAILRREQIYRNRLYSLHVGTNPRSRYKDITPASFESDPELLSRARAWLRRELQVFGFLRTPSSPQGSGDVMTRRRANNAEFLLEYIIAILKTVDIQGSQGAAEDMLSEFLGRENTRLLLHELRNFLRSPWSIETWDRKVRYPPSTAERAKPADRDSQHRDGSPRSRPVRSRMDQRRRRGDSYRPLYSEVPYRRPAASHRRTTGEPNVSAP
ncbi:hypothetical protein F5Y14DRAFT_29888 [Nemania sp. NC0429]|nr:hypothetical protein F5Y14DRAFT_29888 [Nemania sp. NC0429]